MADDDGRVNCILAVCCPAGSEAQRLALTDHVVDGTGLDHDTARRVATWMLDSFDLAPHGSLTAFKGAIAKLARGPQSPPGKP